MSCVAAPLSTHGPIVEVVRAKLVLLAAEGLTDVEIAARLDCTDRMVAKWRRRFAQEGLAGAREAVARGMVCQISGTTVWRWLS